MAVFQNLHLNFHLVKRKEVISALANKLKLRNKPTQSKVGRPKIKLTENQKEWLKNLLDKPDIAYVTPGQKDDHRYVGKVAGKSQLCAKTISYVDTQ